MASKRLLSSVDVFIPIYSESLEILDIDAARMHSLVATLARLFPSQRVQAVTDPGAAMSGADGLVLFNRFYQPDIDLEHLEVRPNILLSTPMAMRVPLRRQWGQPPITEPVKPARNYMTSSNIRSILR